MTRQSTAPRLPAESTSPPEGRTLTAGVLFPLAALAALGALTTNIILPAFPAMDADVGVSVRDLSAT